MPNEIQLLDAHKELVAKGYDLKFQESIQLKLGRVFPELNGLMVRFKRVKNGNLKICIWPNAASYQENFSTVVKEGDVIYATLDISILILSDKLFSVYVKK